MKRTHRALLALSWLLACSAFLPAGEVLRPVNSHMMDTPDDPERTYAGMPMLDWSYFGDRMRYVSRLARGTLGVHQTTTIDQHFAFIQNSPTEGNVPLDKVTKEILGLDGGKFPILWFAGLGKIQGVNMVVDMDAVRDFIKVHPNVTWGGGRIGEFDGMFLHFYDVNTMFRVRPIGPYGSDFQNGWFDVMNSYMRRGGTPFLAFNFNQSTQMQISAKERMLSLGMSQLFWRGASQTVQKMQTLRSAANQYPFPYAFQWSGSAGAKVLNEDDVIAKKAEPVFDVKHLIEDDGDYMSSLALCRQIFYLSWLNGARYFGYEGGNYLLLKFVEGADKFIGSMGKPGPVQAPIALISEYSHPWQAPVPDRFMTMKFKNADHTSYGLGDYQKHGMHGFYMPFYLQSEVVYEDKRTEDYALTDAPYGECVDFLLSDVRDQALVRYGLLIWSGIPPRVPSMVRDKLERYIENSHGRVLLFGDAAKRMFPEWFDDKSTETIPAGANVAYNGKTFAEKRAFLMHRLKNDGKGIPQMQVVATVNGKPLMIECMGGLLVVLSDYGLDKDQVRDPNNYPWKKGDVFTEMPHNLLDHARAILDAETRKQIPFTVNTATLHYVVTRPRPGEYLLGLFNDRMTSQAFKIDSHIGTITKLEELQLNDQKELIKKSCNGVPYAPTGFRRQVSIKPYDYGLSDASNIEGKDFRLFKISVQEQGVREVPRIVFPSRPAGRVLALPEIGHVRHKLQNIASFFDWFDGVKVDAKSLLSEEDQWLNEQKLYLDSRAVRIVVDASQASEAEALKALAKLALFARAPRNLIVKNSTPALESAAKKAMVDVILDSTVNRVSLPEHGFSSQAKLNILELYYASEEDLYQDVGRFASAKGTGAVKGRRSALDHAESPTDDGTGFNYVGPYIYDLGALIHKYDTAFKQFKGIRIDSWYLRNKTTEALASETGDVIKSGYRLVVDMRRDQSYFDGITLDEWRDNYAEGKRRFTEVCTKMQKLGVADMVFSLDKSRDKAKLDKDDKKKLEKGKAVEPKTSPREIRDKFLSEFLDIAKQHNVNLHLVFSDEREKFTKFLDTKDPHLFAINGNGTLKESPIQIRDILIEGNEDLEAIEGASEKNQGNMKNAGDE